MMPTRRDRRTLLFGIATMATIVAVSRGVPAWSAWDKRARTEASESSDEVQRLTRQLHDLPMLRDSVRVRRMRAAASADRLISGATVGIAGTVLAAKVTEVADELGIRISAVQIRPDSLFRASFARIAVRLVAAGDIEQLADLLSTLESAGELLAIRELSVTPVDPLLADGRAETLNFQVLVEGLAVQTARAAKP